MSGYDALDELYERLRGTEDAQRAGGITPETIRAARGGVAGENGRIPATAAESAARADSVPLAGDSRDTRERIEADAWEAARLHMSRTWEERRDAIVALLDRQARLTERECLELGAAVQNQRDKKFAELQAKLDELRAKLDEYDQTHMLLPVDADGVPIRLGDKMKYADGTEFEVDGIGLGGTLFSVDDASNSAWWTNAEDKRHAPERTVEDVLRDLVDGIGSVDFDALTAIDGAAAEIRGLLEVDA